MSQGERRLAAIMFTDIVGYTSLSQRNEKLALKLLEIHRSMMRQIFARHKGREVKTMGDAFMVRFESALEAVECAVEMQEVMHNQNDTAPEKVEMKVGIHVGDVVQRDNDVHGDAVNIASRIEPLAKGGEICISQQVYDQVRNKIPFKLVKLGPHDLKNVAVPIDVYKVELPWEGGGNGMKGSLDRRRLAVLPLDNISPDPNDEYFADGLTEEMITALSRINGLEVIARTSVLRYKGGAKQVATIAEELHVGSVLEGSVRKSGNRIRVTAQLIDASREAHIWADTYDRQLDDIFAVQSEIAGKVAEALRIEFTASEGMGRRFTPGVEAYTLFLKGRFAGTKLNKESLLKAIDFFEKAVGLEPEFASGYAELASSWLILGFFELLPPTEALTKARLYAAKALELDNTLAGGHVAMGRILRLYDWKFAEAEEELKRATELEPNLASAHVFRSQGLDALGRHDEAVAEVKRALELDPFSVLTCQIAGTTFLYANRYDEAIEMYERALELDPNSPFPMGNLGLSYVQKGMYDKGIPLIERANAIEKSNASSKNDLAYAYGKAGRMDDARKILEELLEMHRDSQRAAPAIAGVYTTLGEYDKAFEWLGKSLEQHIPYLASIHRDFIFDPIRSDPRYPGLIRAISPDLP